MSLNIDFGTNLYFFQTSIFVDEYVCGCQLPHIPMLCFIVLFKNKTTNAANKLLYDTQIMIFNKSKKNILELT